MYRCQSLRSPNGFIGINLNGTSLTISGSGEVPKILPCDITTLPHSYKLLVLRATPPTPLPNNGLSISLLWGQQPLLELTLLQTLTCFIGCFPCLVGTFLTPLGSPSKHLLISSLIMQGDQFKAIKIMLLPLEGIVRLPLGQPSHIALMRVCVLLQHSWTLLMCLATPP